MASAQAGAQTGAQGCRSEPFQLLVCTACHAAQEINIYCQGTVKKNIGVVKYANILLLTKEIIGYFFIIFACGNRRLCASL